MAELPTRRDFEDYGAWAGRDVAGPDGERLGAVDVIFLDEATETPEWVLVTLDGGDPAFVPLAGASVEERSIRVEHDRDRIAAAPSPEPAETLSVADERRLYEHYGLAYSQDESASVLPEGATAEERPRLRKYVGAPVPAPAAEEPAAAAAERRGRRGGGARAGGGPDRALHAEPDHHPRPRAPRRPARRWLPDHRRGVRAQACRRGPRSRSRSRPPSPA